MSLIALFFLFAYIGFCVIGGGLVGISIMQQELIPRGLITESDFYAMIAVAESTPGPIGVNMATFIGYKLHGVLGGIVLTAGLVLPSFVVIVLIAAFAKSLKENTLVKKSLYGIRASATGMIAVAAWGILSITILNRSAISSLDFKHVLNIPQLIFFVASLALMRSVKKLHPIMFVVAGAVFGILFL
ncbi:MAG: chromate transporter [Treponema sp.]|nr:MAG: chromate transporter [Treponema sp.]